MTSEEYVESVKKNVKQWYDRYIQLGANLVACIGFLLDNALISEKELREELGVESWFIDIAEEPWTSRSRHADNFYATLKEIERHKTYMRSMSQ